MRRSFDASLCHGSAGPRAHLSSLVSRDREVVFRTAAVDWFVRTLEMRGEGHRHRRLSAWSAGRWVDSTSLLADPRASASRLARGRADVDPGWDRLLLCS